MAMKGAPSTLVVCVWRGRGTGHSDSCRFQHQYFQCGAPVYQLRGDTLFRGIGHRAPWGGHHGAGTIASLLGCGARDVISVSNEPGDILDTVVGGGGLFLCLI